MAALGKPRNAGRQWTNRRFFSQFPSVGALLLADAGWTCQPANSANDKEPVGGVFIDEHCEKSTPARHLALDRALYRRPGDPLKDFVSQTRLEIRGPE